MCCNALPAKLVIQVEDRGVDQLPLERSTSRRAPPRFRGELHEAMYEGPAKRWRAPACVNADEERLKVGRSTTGVLPDQRLMRRTDEVVMRAHRASAGGGCVHMLTLCLSRPRRQRQPGVLPGVCGRCVRFAFSGFNPEDRTMGLRGRCRCISGSVISGFNPGLRTELWGARRTRPAHQRTG
jgi:hypothetical protein